MKIEDIRSDVRYPILRSGWKVIGRSGFEKSSVQDIAEEAEVSKSLVFKYFGTRDKLMKELVVTMSELIITNDREAVKSLPEDADVFRRLRTIAERRMILFKEIPELYGFGMKMNQTTDPVVKNLVAEMIQRYMVEVGIINIEESVPENKLLTSKEAVFLIEAVNYHILNTGLHTSPESIMDSFMTWMDKLEKIIKGEC